MLRKTEGWDVQMPYCSKFRRLTHQKQHEQVFGFWGLEKLATNCTHDLSSLMSIWFNETNSRQSQRLLWKEQRSGLSLASPHRGISKTTFLTTGFATSRTPSARHFGTSAGYCCISSFRDKVLPLRKTSLTLSQSHSCTICARSFLFWLPRMPSTFPKYEKKQDEHFWLQSTPQ